LYAFQKKKVFWNCKLAQETANTLHQLLLILLKHENRTVKRKSISNISSFNNAQQSDNNETPELTSAQISQTVYISCIALARLISENYGSKYKTWQPGEDLDEDELNLSLEATTLYLMALKEKYELCTDSVQEFSDVSLNTFNFINFYINYENHKYFYNYYGYSYNKCY